MTQLLVIDDDPIFRALLQRDLTRRGWAVTEAASLAEAHSCLEQHRYAVVVLDLGLPDGSGWEVCAAWPQIAVVVTTTQPVLQAYRTRYRPARVFEKPLRLKSLLQFVERYRDLNSHSQFGGSHASPL